MKNKSFPEFLVFSQMFKQINDSLQYILDYRKNKINQILHIEVLVLSLGWVVTLKLWRKCVVISLVKFNWLNFSLIFIYVNYSFPQRLYIWNNIKNHCKKTIKHDSMQFFGCFPVLYWFYDILCVVKVQEGPSM